MRRHGTVSRKTVKTRRRKTTTAKPSSAPVAARRNHSPIFDLQEKLKREIGEREEAQEQLAATSEVLKVISASAGELEPVFGAMLENATRICEATSGLLVRAENDGYRIVASLHQRADLEDMKLRTFRFGPSTPIGRSVRTRQIVHVANLSEDRAYLEREPLAVWAVEQGNVRTVLVVPMLKREELVGVFGLERKEVKPFTDKQIALVQTFAAQAVIAIENTRLLNELRQRTTDLTESLEQQTATADVLKIISSSPGDLEPVFQVMLENAARVCEAQFGILFRLDDGVVHVGAMLGAPPALAEFMQNMRRPGPTTATARAIRTGQAIHILDIREEKGYREGDPMLVFGADKAGIRTLLVVPMLKDEVPIGSIGVYRTEVRPFTDKQIELLRNFAAQAVIAIENTRLLNELRQRTADLTESLEQQTATSEVLGVISSSPGDLEPVFATMLENAVRICDAKFGNIYRWHDDGLHLVASHNTPPAFADARRRSPLRRTPNPLIDSMVTTKAATHLIDAAAQPGYIDRSDPGAIDAVELGGARTVLAVPMLKENELIGSFTVYRQEVRPFTEKQIALVTNFAAQAVIAIENTRLLNELRESLEQQTATSYARKLVTA